jgi:hypothetical protein
MVVISIALGCNMQPPWWCKSLLFQLQIDRSPAGASYTSFVMHMDAYTPPPASSTHACPATVPQTTGQPHPKLPVH